MDDSIYSALINASAQMASSALGTAATAVENKKAKQFTREFFDYQNQANRKETEYYWNTYNSPTAQMSAYRAAGLNPNLIYGSNNMISPVSSRIDTPDYNSPLNNVSGGLSALGQVAQQYFTNRLAEKASARQDAKVQSDIARNDSTITSNGIRNSLLTSQTQLNQLKAELMRTTNPLRVKYLQKQIDQIQSNIDNTTFMQSLQNKLYKLKLRGQIARELDSQRDYTLRREQLGLNKQQLDLNKQLRTDELDWRKNPASANSWTGALIRLGGSIFDLGNEYVNQHNSFNGFPGAGRDY